MRLGSGLLLAIVCGCGLIAAPRNRATDPVPVADTSAGRVQGVFRPEGGAEFRGIPFAAPPVGARRWRPPAPVEPWKGTRDATTFGSPCPQPVLGEWNRANAEQGREDCLTLNVVVGPGPTRVGCR